MLDMDKAADMEADMIDEDGKWDAEWDIEDKTVLRIVSKQLDRARNSNKKYNNTIYNVDKPLGKWASEALAESLDQSVYIQRIIETIAEIGVHIEDLGWEAQRMSSSGRDTLKILWEYFEIPWDDSIDKGENYG